MKKLVIFLAILGVVALIAFLVPTKLENVVLLNEKVYVAVEDDGVIAVIDPIKLTVVSRVDLSEGHQGGMLMFAPHNVQVSPDNKSVWVTANASMNMDHTSFLAPSARAHGDEMADTAELDQVIVISPETDRIVKRIPIATGVHLAHVAFTPDGAFAYVTAQNEGAAYKINARTFAVEKRIALPQASQPHGLRIAPDGLTAYLAMLGSKGMGIIDTLTDSFTNLPLDGAAVQTGVTPDGKFAVVSLYDTKQLAIYHTDTKAVSYVQLPASAKGPIQMYPTPDSRFAYLADQGYYFGQPSSEWVYKIDLAEEKITNVIKAGQAPHGVVVSRDGAFVYVSNLLSNDVSVIDTVTNLETARIPVGKSPNGVSVWYRP